jgi:hypothetical protein
LYLLIIIFGISGELLIRSSIIVPGDYATTVDNILGDPGFYRAGFLADTIMLFCDVALAILLYQIFSPVNRNLSLMAAVFRLIQASIIAANLLNYYAPLLLTSTITPGTEVSSATGEQVMFYLELHRHGYDLGLLFFAVSNLLLGYLVTRSGYLPAILGYGLQAAAIVYLVGSSTLFLFPQYSAIIQPAYIIPLVAETAFCLWLLIRGIRPQN